MTDTTTPTSTPVTAPSTDAVAACRRLIAAFDEQIKYVESRRKSQLGTESGQIPSRNQEFFYVSNDNGVINVQVDADFVACQLFIVSDMGQFFVGAGLEVSMEDLSSYRSFTFADDQVFNSTPREPSNRVDIGVLVPQGKMDYVPIGAAGYQSENNADYWFSFPAEYLIPRGGVVRFRVRQPGGTNVFTNAGTDVVRKVVLAGYKVFN